MAVITPDMMIMHVGSHASIPSGYSRETAMDGKFIKGWGAEAPNVAGGSAGHSHTSPAHTHALDHHTHTFSTGNETGSGQDCSGGTNTFSAMGHYMTSHSITATQGGTLNDAVSYASVDWEPEHIRVIFIKPTSTNQAIPDGACIFYMSDTLPAGSNWAFYTDADARFIRGADTGEDGGEQAGSATHEHSINHTHSTVGHTHTGLAQNASHCNRDGSIPNGNAHSPACGHYHDVTLNSTNLTSSAYTGSAGSADTGIEPLHKKVRIIQNVSGNPQSVPLGGIVASLSLTTAPRGWAMKTALQDYFIKSTGTNGQQGTTAGSNSHSHALSNSHTHTDTTGAHTHTGSTSADIGQRGQTGVSSESASNSGHTHAVQSVGTNTASWQNAQTQANSTDWQPPYRTASFLVLEKNIAGGQFLEDDL